MEPTDLKIVCYTGGTCGDLISALIDPQDVQFKMCSIMHHPDRIKLKKPFLMTDEQKQRYIEQISTKYNSIVSHDLNYHVDHNQQFITITVKDFSVAQHAAQRFKDLHRPHVWEEMSANCGAVTVNDYAQILIDYSNMVTQHTEHVLELERIFSNDVVEDLEKIQWKKCNNGKNIYKQWIKLQNTL